MAREKRRHSALERKKVRRCVVNTTMDAVTILRDLWRHRLLVVAVVALSVLAGIVVLYKFSPPLQLESRKYDVGVATTKVLIDTPSSQVARIAPEGNGDLGGRADLLSRIMVEGTV